MSLLPLKINKAWVLLNNFYHFDVIEGIYSDERTVTIFHTHFFALQISTIIKKFSDTGTWLHITLLADIMETVCALIEFALAQRPEFANP